MQVPSKYTIHGLLLNLFVIYLVIVLGVKVNDNGFVIARVPTFWKYEYWQFVRVFYMLSQPKNQTFIGEKSE